MNSKTLEMLEKFVGEEDNEELENLGEKINIFGEQMNENQNFNNDLIDNNEDINKLFEKINRLESNEENENKNSENDEEGNNENKNENQGVEDVNSNKNENENHKLEVLYNIFIKKEENLKLIYFDHWKNLNLINQEKNINKEINLIENNEIEKEGEINNENLNNSNDIDNNINNDDNDISNQKDESKNKIKENDNSLNEILQNNEEELEDHTQSEIITQHQNQLLKSETNNFHNNNSFTQIGDINFDNFFSNDTKNNNKITNNLLAISSFNIIKHKIYLYQKKLFSCLKHKSIISNYHDKLYQLDKLNKKYEAILDEKSSIIINKTDEMEELKEKIEKLNKSLKEANKKNKNLNVIQESLCAKCGGSLEESFTGDVIAENQKIINEQNESIELLKKELNELKTN